MTLAEVFAQPPPEETAAFDSWLRGTPMKAYGMTKEEAIQYPDRADIAAGGLPSKFGRLKSKNRAATRRRQARRARKASKAACTES